MQYPHTQESSNTAISTTAVTITLPFAPAQRYTVTSSVACWILQSTAGTTATATNSYYLPANTAVNLAGLEGSKLSVLGSAAGTICLCRLGFA